MAGPSSVDKVTLNETASKCLSLLFHCSFKKYEINGQNYKSMDKYIVIILKKNTNI